MTRPNYRIERVNELIKEVLSELVLTEIKDPRVGLITITGVRVTNDLSSAKVLFSVMGDEAQRAMTLKTLKAASGFLRRVLVRHMDVRVAPELRWVYDDSLDRAFRIEQALRETGTIPNDEPEPKDE
ncbi:MAG TPA: 30S ribosome-binding factor RbfA [Candidatus Krumholzibacteria bacterium]|nr:30S ribosome-binding factor RbfA [Candidatus Krumholzibacteria bacterium]